MENSGEHQMLLVDAVSLCGPLLNYRLTHFFFFSVYIGYHMDKMDKKSQNTENVPLKRGEITKSHLKGVKIKEMSY